MNFSIKGGGDKSEYSSMYGLGYENIAVNGTISGIPGYTYNDVTITLRFTFTYEDWGGGKNHISYNYQQSLTQTVSLNLGGNGNINAKDLKLLRVFLGVSGRVFNYQPQTIQNA